ncbi:amino acid permease [Mycobacterium antarcticum]|uniref:amino acid permease n=1 Tax=Mycolicibacterium sp. TUM20984 TaxID=3023368 RepID=UPI00238C52F4|nr:amino acid permease [Mycolicibacterium sp. TUM20984]GLP83030.1 amino acid permease [Mycolicibacterium sp. TUM20984]
MIKDEHRFSSDETELNRLGYRQELARGIKLWSAFSLGVAAISPVVGIFAVMSLGLINAGPAWVWVVPIALICQITVAAVYAELSSQFPVAGGAYQWVRRLVGNRLGWFTGYFYIVAVTAALTTVAYLGGSWLYLLIWGEAPGPAGQVICGAILLAISLVVNILGVNPLKYIVNAGIIAEALASVGVGILLIVFFREHSFSTLWSSMGAPGNASFGAGFLAALAVGGWAFIGFDSCAQISEETVNARRDVPRAILRSITVVGGVVILTAFSVTLSLPDLDGAVRGEVLDPVTTSVVGAFGPWAERPFVAVVLISFIACVIAIQTYLGRAAFSMGRDNMLPGSKVLRIINGRKAPLGAIAVVTMLAGFGLLLGLNASAVGTLITFGTGGFFIIYLLVATSALYARLTGRWDPAKGSLALGKWGLVLNVFAVAWLIFETVNIAWPRAVFAPPGAPFIQVWAVVVVFTAAAAIGLAYMIIRRPQARIEGSSAFNDVASADATYEQETAK